MSAEVVPATERSIVRRLRMDMEGFSPLLLLLPPFGFFYLSPRVSFWFWFAFAVLFFSSFFSQDGG
jgi:hypothetical protein